MGIQECYDFEDYFNACDPFEDDATDSVKWFDEDYPPTEHSNAVQFFTIMLTLIGIIVSIGSITLLLAYHKGR